jgi:hypothetical protein
MRIFIGLTTSLVFVQGLLAAAPEVQVTTLDGRSIAGEVRTISSEQVTVLAGGAEASIKGADLHSLTPVTAGAAPAEKPAAWVELVDGSRLAAKEYLSKNGKVTVTLIDGASLPLTTRQVRSVRFSKLDDPEAEIADPQATGDLIGVKKRESVDFLEGVIGDVTKEAVHFTLEGQSVPVNLARIDSLLFAHRANDDGGDAACAVEETSGTLIKASSIELKEGKVHLRLLAGSTIERPFAAVRRVDFSTGKLAYLSELKPERVHWTSFFDLGKQSPALARFLGPRFDRGREEEVMKLAGKAYKKGVSLTSRTELVYKVPARSKRFMALAGIDDNVGNLGSVQLEIAGDGRKLYSGKLTGADEPVALDLDLSGVRRLTILVDFGDDLDVADHLNLCDARIVK